MTPNPLVMDGTIQQDGTLKLDGTPNLPPGRVRVAITPQTSPEPIRDDWWTVLQRIWKDREARGVTPRTAEEIDAEVNALRDELEEHANMIERIQEEAQREREGKPTC